MPKIEIKTKDDEYVYECWIGSEKETFTKFTKSSFDAMMEWLGERLKQMPYHSHLHVVLHHTEDYAPNPV